MGKRIFAIAMALAMLVVMALPIAISAETSDSTVAVSGTVGVAPTVTSCTPNNGDYTGGTSGTYAVTIAGNNFIQGTISASAVSVSGTDVTVGTITVVNTNEITTTFTIESDAAPGARNVSVTCVGQTGTGTGAFTVNEYMTIDLPAMALGTMTVGVAATDDITATVTTNTTSWTIGATDNNAGTGTGYMLKSGTPLTNAFLIGNAASPTTPASSTISYTQAGGTSLPFYVSQTVSSGDTAGVYSITIKFTGTY